MRGAKTEPHPSRRSKASALKVMALVCLILLTLITVIQVTHFHASDSDANHCTLCVAMHSVVPFLLLVVTASLVRIGTNVEIKLEVRDSICFWYHSLFIRPPPSCS